MTGQHAAVGKSKLYDWFINQGRIALSFGRPYRECYFETTEHPILSHRRKVHFIWFMTNIFPSDVTFLSEVYKNRMAVSTCSISIYVTMRLFINSRVCKGGS